MGDCGMAWRRPPLECDGYSVDDRGVTVKCHELLTRRTAHRVVISERQLAIGRVDETLGLFCERHCPGDCQNPRCTRQRQ